MRANLWQARLCLTVAAALAIMLLLSSCGLPGQKHSSSASMDQKTLTIIDSNNPAPIVLPMYPGTGPGGVSSRGGLFGSTTEATATTGAPVASVAAFYQEKLAAQRPRISVKGQETQFKWRDQHSRFTLTVAPAPGGAGTQIKVHIQG